MISGTKISQLNFVNDLQNTDYLPLARGSNTRRIDGQTLTSAITAQVPVPNAFFSTNIDVTATNLQLSGQHIKIVTPTLTLTGSQIIETNSSNAALRVTQTGSGDALVIEDSTNPDSTPFRVDSLGRIVVGSQSSIYGGKCEIYSDTTVGPWIAFKKYTNDNDGSYFAFIKTRGTTPESNITVIQNDILGTIVFQGTDNNSNRVAAIIASEVDGIPVPSLSSVPGRLVFETTLSGNTIASERMRITHDGKVGIGTVAPNMLLTVAGNISADTIFANLSGQTSSGNRWTTPRLVSLSGGVLGSSLIDGSQDVTIHTVLSTGAVTNINIASNAQISDTKLATINTPNKVTVNAIDSTGSVLGQILVSTGSSTPPTWQTPSLINTSDLTDNSVNTAKIADGSVTLTKTNATSANVIDSLVARNQFGEFAATAVHGNLIGNAETATQWLQPRQITFEGAIKGVFALDGSTDITVPIEGDNLASAWVNFDGTQTEAVSCQYVQSSATNILTINTPVEVEVVSLTGIYTQGNFSFPTDIAEIIFLSGNLINDDSFINQYLLGGNTVTLTFLSGVSLDPLVPFLNNPNGQYVIQTGVPAGRYINVNVNNTQLVSGEVVAEFLKVTPAFSLNHLSGHIINLDFIDGYNLGTNTPLPGGSLNSSGLYTVLSSISNTTISVSSTFVQESSGNVNIIRTHINQSSNIASVTRKNTGDFILNITPSLRDSKYFYTGLARAIDDTLSVGSVGTLLNDAKTNAALEIRTIINNGSLSYYNSSDTNVIIYE